MKRTVFVAIALCIFAIASQFTHVAATDGLANTISVSPATLSFELTQENSQKVSTLTIRNDYDSAIDLNASLQGIDVNAGKVLPVGEPSAAILETLKLSETAFRIPAHENYYLKVTATDSSGLAAGGNYATLVLTNNTGSAQRSGVVVPKLSVGIFVVKRQGETQNTILTKAQRLGRRFGLPVAVSLEFLNDGNTHTIPRASIQIIDTDRRVVSEGIFNQDSKILLPGQKLQQNVPLTQHVRAFVPQRLTMRVQYRHEGSDSIKIYEQKFWYIPPVYFMLVVTGVMLVFVRRVTGTMQKGENTSAKTTKKKS